MTEDLADAPTGMPYRQYWDDDEHLAGLREQIVESLTGHSGVLDPNTVVDTLMVEVFKRVKLHTWCAKPGCFRESCGPTHYTFDITTHPRRFADEKED